MELKEATVCLICFLSIFMQMLEVLELPGPTSRRRDEWGLSLATLTHSLAT